MNKKGFTLIELMVVVAIIGILVTIAIIAGNSAKAVVRDNQRKTDIRLLQIKLESYMEQYGKYPTDLDAQAGQSPLTALINPNFSTIPTDPKDHTDYIYTPLQFSGGSCGASYYLATNLENTNTVSLPTITNLLSCDGNAFVVPTDNPNLYAVTSPSSFK